MLTELLAELRSPDFDEEASFRCVALATTDECVSLDVLIQRSDGGKKQGWRIECEGVRSYRLRDGSASWLDLVDEHPLLLPFTDETSQLFFRGEVPDPSSVIGDLYQRHREIAGLWIPLERFVNGLASSTTKLLTEASGMLAAGPVTLLRGYADVLNAHGVRTSMLETQPPRRWDGSAWVEPPPVRAFIVGQTPFDSSYVVAERFDGRRLSD